MEHLFEICERVLNKMTSSIANLNGTNVTRLHVAQMGSSQTQCMLETALIDDADTQRYTVTVERLYLSTDIPIFPHDTLVFRVCYQPIGAAVDGAVPAPDEHDYCRVGPVYNFLDFCQQVEAWCERYNNTELTARIYVSGNMASKKQFALRANADFWEDKFLHFSNEFGRLWQTFGDEGYYNMRLSGQGFADLTEIVRLGAGNVEDHTALYWTSVTTLPEYTPLFNWANVYVQDFVTRALRNRSDFFENRVAIRIDTVIPTPFEVFAVGTEEGETARGKAKHNFMQIDFPQEVLSHELTTHTNRLSDTYKIKQDLQSGIFELVQNSMNTFGKTMIPGQLQDHRYELLLVRKTFDENRKVKFQTEPLEFSSGDFFLMSLVFTKQI